MPTRHGFSHGLATFVTIMAAGLFVGVLRLHIPFFIGLFDKVGLWLSRLIERQLSIEFSPQILSTGVFAALMAFVWGVAFAYLNRRRWNQTYPLI